MSKIGWALVVTAVLGTAAYWGGLPLAQRVLRANLPKIESAASELLGSRVRFDALEPRLSGLRAEFEFRNVRVEEEDTPTLSAARVALEIDVLESWNSRRILFDRVLVENPALNFRERAPGEWVVRGLDSLFKDPPGGSAGAAEQWMSSNFRIVLENSAVTIQPWDSQASVSTIERLESGFSREAERKVMDLRAEGILLSVPEWWDSEKLVDGATGKLIFDRSGEVLIEDAVIRYSGMRLAAEAVIPTVPGAYRVGLALDQIDSRRLLSEIPSNLLEQELDRWLDRGVKKGRFSSIFFRVLKASRETPAEVRFTAEVKGLNLDYLEGWPLLKGADGRLSFEDRQLRFEIPKAEWSAMRVKAVKGVIAREGDGGVNVLQLGGTAETGAEALHSFLHDGPLKREAGPFLERMRPEEDMVTGFQLSIPLGGDGSANGSFDLKNGGLHVIDQDIPVREVKGRIRFKEGEVAFQNLRGRAFGDELVFSGKNRTSETGGMKGEYMIESTLPVAWIRSHFSDLPVEEVWEGKLPVQMSVRVERNGEEEGHLRWSIEGRSDLAGLALGLPPPLYKEKHQILPVRWDANGEDRRIRKVRLSAEGDPSGSIHLTVDYRDQDDSRSLSVRARAGEMSAGDWIEAVRLLAEKVASEDTVSSPLDVEARLFAESLKWKDLGFDAVDWTLSKTGSKWRVGVQSLALEGRVEFQTPLAKHTMLARFNRVVLPKFPKNESAPKEDDEPKNPWDLSRWPSLDIGVERLRIGPQLYGQMALAVRQTGTMLKLERFEVKGPELEIRADKGDAAYGTFKICGLEGEMTVHHSRFPTRFKNLNSVEMKRAKIRFKWLWPGGPEAFALSRLTGSMSGTIREGALRGVDSTAATVFNFLSYANDDNRRKVSRYYKSSFDLAFQKGTIVTKDLRGLFGSVFVKITGEAHARGRALKMEARVTPRVDDIPDPEAAGGGGEEPSNLLSHTYRIRGTWDEPSVGLKIF